MEAVKFDFRLIRQEGVGNQSQYEIEKSTPAASKPGVFHLAGVSKGIEDIFDNGMLTQQQFSSSGIGQIIIFFLMLVIR